MKSKSPLQMNSQFTNTYNDPNIAVGN